MARRERAGSWDRAFREGEKGRVRLGGKKGEGGKSGKGGKKGECDYSGEGGKKGEGG